LHEGGKKGREEGRDEGHIAHKTYLATTPWASPGSPPGSRARNETGHINSLAPRTTFFIQYTRGTEGGREGGREGQTKGRRKDVPNNNTMGFASKSAGFKGAE